MAPPQPRRSLMLTTARTSQPNQPWQGGHPKLWMPALFGEQTLRDGEKEKMMDRNVILKTTSMLLAGVLASGILVLRTGAQSAAPAAKSSVTAASTRYRPDRFAGRAGTYRSEEHTSELQSRLHLVCRPLLEKKKTVPCGTLWKFRKPYAVSNNHHT